MKCIRIWRLYPNGTDPKVDQALAAAGFQVVPLDDSFKSKWEQAKKDGNTVAAAGAWTSDKKYHAKFGVSTRTKGGDPRGTDQMQKRLQGSTFAAEGLAADIAEDFCQGGHHRPADDPIHRAAVPASLQLIGPPNSEAELLNAGRIVEAAVLKP